MAIPPLFVANMVTMKTKLRLSGVKLSGEYLIEDALEWARTMFYRRMGTARVALLLGYAYSESPTTENGVLRSIANQTEIKLCRAHLLRTMTSMLKDGSAQGREIWNAEGFMRNRGAQSTRDEVNRLMSEIEDMFDLLIGSEKLGEDSSIRASTIGPARPFHRTAKGLQIYE